MGNACPVGKLLREVAVDQNPITIAEEWSPEQPVKRVAGFNIKAMQVNNAICSKEPCDYPGEGGGQPAASKYKMRAPAKSLPQGRDFSV